MNNANEFTSISRKNDKMVMLALICFIIGILSTSSIIGGYPRYYSQGPYKARTLNYASEYDISALEFIKTKFQNNTNKPFIVGDAYTNIAAVLTLGYSNKVLEGKSYALLSYFRTGEGWNDNSVWRLALEQPVHFVYSAPKDIGNLSEIIYLVITYREQDMMRIVSDYYSIVGPPAFKIDNKVYVFELNDSIDYINHIYSGKIIANNDQVKNNFWSLYQIGKGNSSFYISDTIPSKSSNQNYLLLKIQDGNYERATLRHKFSKPQSWYENGSLSFYFDGMASGASFYVVLLSHSTKDFFSRQLKDLADKPGYVTLPLSSFYKYGEPSWSYIEELRIQFPGRWPHGDIYFDNIILSIPV